jgi:hypothetical protein
MLFLLEDQQISKLRKSLGALFNLHEFGLSSFLSIAHVLLFMCHHLETMMTLSVCNITCYLWIVFNEVFSIMDNKFKLHMLCYMEADKIFQFSRGS